jgi:uncharacterized membrane protein YeaQ/YmgE (transglycosylase-associated protein family)
MGSSILGTIIIGFLAGLLARAFSSDPRNPQGCLLTTILGIAGAATFTWLGQQIGWYEAGDRAGFIGAVLGAVIVLLIWRAAVSARKG